MKTPNLFVFLIAFCFAANSALAVRTISSMSSVANPSSGHRVAGIMSSGKNRITGGVILDGETIFVLEATSGDEELDASTLRLEFEENDVFLVRGDSRFAYEMHRSLVCPLARFVGGEGDIVYSLPSDSSPAAFRQLRSQGLVQRGELEAWVAKEFKTSAHILLLHAMDFADEIELPSDLERSIRESINGLSGAGDTKTNDWASYFNSASMSNITAFLSEDTQTVEMEGIPLRFYWEPGQSGADIISNIAAYSQELGSDTLTDLDALDLPNVDDLGFVDFLTAGTNFNQIDYISAYQSAVLFKTIRAEDIGSFESFELRACQG